MFQEQVSVQMCVDLSRGDIASSSSSNVSDFIEQSSMDGRSKRGLLRDIRRAERLRNF